MSKIHWTMVLLGAINFSSCGPSPQNQDSQVKISGGSEVRENGPSAITRSVVALAPSAEFFKPIQNRRSSYCTGVLVSESVVLTAAHCTELLDRQITLVVFGNSMAEALEDTNNRIREVKGFVRHPDYPTMVSDNNGYPIVRSPYAENPEQWMRDHANKPPHDLALIKFEGGIPEGFAPARFADLSLPIPSSATLAGYGITSAFNVDTSGVLRFVSDVLIHPLDEEYTQRLWLPVAQTMDVTKIDGPVAPKGACPGDSGGPALSFDQNGAMTVLGILSLGESSRYDDSTAFTRCLGHKATETSKIGNVYTDIRHYKSWIEDTAASL